jgi:hypothetical protein
MEMKRITKLILLMDNIDLIVDTIRSSIQSFHDNHQSSIINYDNWQINCEKEKYLRNPDYKIYQLKNRNSIPSVVANVKWKFLYEGKFLNNKATIVYLGNKTKHPDLENDKKLIKQINEIIRTHFKEKSPLSTIDAIDLKSMKEEVELYYYWKNKLVELEYRLNPIHYFSQSKNDKPEQIIINIKWGFEVMGKTSKPRYILKRYSVDKRFVDNLGDPDLDYALKLIVKEHISKVCPIFFDPPHKNNSFNFNKIST